MKWERNKNPISFIILTRFGIYPLLGIVDVHKSCDLCSHHLVLQRQKKKKMNEDVVADLHM